VSKSPSVTDWLDMNSEILIVCPLKKELSYLREAFSRLGWEFESLSTKKLPVFYNRSRSVTLAVGGHGKVQFGIQTSYLLNNLENVKKVFCVGAGGGLAEHLNVGDLVVGEKTIEHDYAEKFELDAKLPEFWGCKDSLEKFRSCNLKTDYKVHFGVIASGDEDIVDPLRAGELFKKTKALAVAWEGSGGAKACRFHGVPYVEIRAITDNARHSVAESFALNLQKSMANAADFINQNLTC
jgi:adenosylhomocysteine nucleosidase